MSVNINIVELVYCYVKLIAPSRMFIVHIKMSDTSTDNDVINTLIVMIFLRPLRLPCIYCCLTNRDYYKIFNF